MSLGVGFKCSLLIIMWNYFFNIQLSHCHESAFDLFSFKRKMKKICSKAMYIIKGVL